MEKLVVMRVYERDAKRLRAKYPQFKSDAMRLDALLNPAITFKSGDNEILTITDGYRSNGSPATKLEVVSNPFNGGVALLDDSMDKSGRVGTTMPKVNLEVRGSVKK